MPLPNVVICIDKHVSPYLSHLIHSVQENTGPVHWYALCNSNVEQAAIDDLKQKGFKVYSNVDVPALNISGIGWGRFANNPTMYYRWAIPNILPVDKAIYLDTDVVVTGDLNELWELDMTNFLTAQVKDQFFARVGDAWKMQCKRAMDKGSNAYAQAMLSGQMVINCALWRAQNVTSKLVKYAIKYKAMDMVPISAVCDGAILELPREWSVPANYIDPYVHPDFTVPKLWHWHGDKPWNKECKNQYIYEQYV